MIEREFNAIFIGKERIGRETRFKVMQDENSAAQNFFVRVPFMVFFHKWHRVAGNIQDMLAMAKKQKLVSFGSIDENELLVVPVDPIDFEPNTGLIALQDIAEHQKIKESSLINELMKVNAEQLNQEATIAQKVHDADIETKKFIDKVTPHFGGGDKK
jgi:hypothetical protein